jgi:hypothetical protein
LADQLLWVGRQPTQDVPEVEEGVDADEATALDERVQDGGPAGALQAAREEPVLASHRHHAQLALGAVVVDGQAAVLDEALQRRPLVVEVAQRITQG